MPPGRIRVGCAGWTLPSAKAGAFPGPGSHLERYGRVLPAVEVNSSFYGPHRRETWERWAASVPEDFRFSAKVPRTITHFRRLRDAEEPLEAFLAEVGGLGPKVGPLLVQLPPSLSFDEEVARRFFSALRARHAGAVVCEPRHPTWFGRAAGGLLREWRIARVAADPACVSAAARPGGWPGIRYFRLHGSPRMYVSAYSRAFLRRLAATLLRAARRAETWCVFDNTAAGAALDDARALLALCDPGRSPRARPADTPDTVDKGSSVRGGRRGR
jgi:uncharacterized protein YecE (DUF72 family)